MSSRDPFPKHPADERKAAAFHLFVAGIGVIHVIAGGLMIWYHLAGAERHWRDRE